MSPSVASASPARKLLPFEADGAHIDSAPAKISAYYSLVFPNITFYLQTLTVTIGRRCIPPASSSVNGADGVTSSPSPVDVDLGPLKSVSRLHAKIEYEEEEERFVLVVVGRNGAWVDGVWSGAGSRVPLCERSQIQIASRTFHFVLPPPPAPEDSPSPSSTSSVQRARSPSVDITSISPPSSLPSHSPPPRAAPPLPLPKAARSPEPQLPNSNAIPRTKNASASTSTPQSTSTAPTSKKRKKPSQPLPKPEVMPPKPQLTYAQLCYRAIKAMGGKATLQDICGWMIDNYDWYRYNEGAGWENSVRHNLSSGRAFKKMERSTGEHGKGFFWSVDEQYEHTFEEQDARALAQTRSSSQLAPPPPGAKEGTGKGSRKKDKAIPLDPPLKRSVKMGPLPPPLTSTPLAFSSTSAFGSGSPAPHPGQPNGGFAQGGLLTTAPRATVGADAAVPSLKAEPVEPIRIGSVTPAGGMPVANASALTYAIESTGVTSANTPGPGSTSLSDTSFSTALTIASPSPLAALPPSVCLPIVVGAIPSSHPSSTTSEPPPIILHNNTLVLSPVIFSSLAPEQLKALEEMGAQKALEVLQGHIVRYLKERMGRKKRKKVASGGAGAEKGGTKNGKGDVQERSSPFTTAPLSPRIAQSTPQSQSQSRPTPNSTADKESIPSFVDSRPPVPVPITDIEPVPSERPESPIIVVDDEDGEDGRAAKRRKIGDHVENMATDIKKDVGVMRAAESVDEDIEIDVC
ncbi:hypothetical protein BU15DRAFT_39341 [Melanogaster broomeanus]|nr:hypothetical protein BU15DRAFT_39341 [Melanogaster broomeanus]